MQFACLPPGFGVTLKGETVWIWKGKKRIQGLGRMVIYKLRAKIKQENWF